MAWKTSKKRVHKNLRRIYEANLKADTCNEKMHILNNATLIYKSLTVMLVSKKGLVFLPHKCIQSSFKTIFFLSSSVSEQSRHDEEVFGSNGSKFFMCQKHTKKSQWVRPKVHLACVLFLIIDLLNPFHYGY